MLGCHVQLQVCWALRRAADEYCTAAATAAVGRVFSALLSCVQGTEAKHCAVEYLLQRVPVGR